MKKSGRTRQARTFFLTYFAVITILLVWNLFHCTRVSWMTRRAYIAGNSVSDQGILELTDGNPAVLEVSDGAADQDRDAPDQLPRGARLRGVSFNGYENTHGLRFTEESIQADLITHGGEETAGTGTLLLKNQTPFPNDETRIYIPFSDGIGQTAREDLQIRLTSSGLERNGICFRTEAVEPAGQETGNAGEKESEPAGQETGGSPDKGTGNAGSDRRYAADLYYERKVWSPLVSILYFVVEAAAGLFCLLLYSERRLPLFSGAGGGRRLPLFSGTGVGRRPGRQGQEPRRPGGSVRLPQVLRGAKPSARQLAGAGAILFACVLLMTYTRVHVVKKAAAGLSAAPLTTEVKSGEALEILPGTSVRQTFAADQDRLAGIGIRFLQVDGVDTKPAASIQGKKDPAMQSDLRLSWRLLDASGTAVLSEGAATIAELRKVSASMYAGGQDEKVFETAQDYRLLPLDRTVQASAGKEMTLELSLPAEGQPEGAEAGIRVQALTNGNGTLEVSGQDTDGGTKTGEPVQAELSLMGCYDNNGFLSGMYLHVCIALCVILALVFFAADRLRGRAAALYLVCALCMGMVFSFMTPAFTISDERTHIDTVYILSNRLLGIMDEPGPRRIWKRACDVDTSIANTMPVESARYRDAALDLFGPASKEPGGTQAVPAYVRNSMDNVPVLCYLPAALGFTLMRLLGRNLITMIMAARWASLLACCLVTCAAVRRMPYGGACLAVIALFPKTLQQTASCSYDGMVIAGTFLFIAYCLAAARDGEFSVTDLLTLILSGIFVASCKGGVYLPVLGLAVLVPFGQKTGAGTGGRSVRQEAGLQKLRRLIPWIICGSAVFLFAGKYVSRLISMFSRESGAAKIAAGTRTLYTFSDFIKSPLRLIRICLNTLDVRGDGLIGELVGKNLSQKWWIVYAFLALAFLGILHETSDQGEGPDAADADHLKLPGRLWLLFLAACSTGLVFLSMLLAFTEKGMTYVDGLQGRYFLPVVPLLFLAAETGRIRRVRAGDNAILCAAAVLLTVTFCEIMLYYFGV